MHVVSKSAYGTAVHRNLDKQKRGIFLKNGSKDAKEWRASCRATYRERKRDFSDDSTLGSQEMTQNI